MPRSTPRRVDGAREHTGDPAFDRLQQTTTRLARALRDCPFLVGKVRRVRFVADEPRAVNHKLGVPAEFIVISGNHLGTGDDGVITKASTISQEGLDPKNQLSMYATVDGVFDIWFYPRLFLEVE